MSFNILFLDEFADLPLPAQVRLLRILQDGTLERVGGEQTLTVDVRVIAATHKDLERLVKEDVYTSVHIEEFELQVRDTKRGVEEITREIPNVGEEALRNLDEDGVIYIGARVRAVDVPAPALRRPTVPFGDGRPRVKRRFRSGGVSRQAHDLVAVLRAPLADLVGVTRQTVSVHLLADPGLGRQGQGRGQKGRVALLITEQPVECLMK